jgi:hypothetical protein
MRAKGWFGWMCTVGPQGSIGPSKRTLSKSLHVTNVGVDSHTDCFCFVTGIAYKSILSTGTESIAQWGREEPFDLFLMFNWNLKTSLKINWKARLWNIFSAYTSKLRGKSVNRQVGVSYQCWVKYWIAKKGGVWSNVGLRMFSNLKLKLC